MKKGMATDNNLVKLRGDRKVQELADQIGCKKATLQAWQAGRRTPGIEWVYPIEKAFGVPVSQIWPQLFGGVSG